MTGFPGFVIYFLALEWLSRYSSILTVLSFSKCCFVYYRVKGAGLYISQ